MLILKGKVKTSASTSSGSEINPDPPFKFWWGSGRNAGKSGSGQSLLRLAVNNLPLLTHYWWSITVLLLPRYRSSIMREVTKIIVIGAANVPAFSDSDRFHHLGSRFHVIGQPHDWSTEPRVSAGSAFKTYSHPPHLIKRGQSTWCVMTCVKPAQKANGRR